MSGSVLIVCPSLRGLSPRIATALAHARDDLRLIGYDVPVPLISPACPLYFARSLMLDQFLSGKHDVMLSFDDDTEFRSEDAKALVGAVLSCGVDFVGGSYAQKRIAMERLRAVAADEKKTDLQVLEDAAHTYCVQFTKETLLTKRLEGFTYLNHQFARVDWVGGGFWAMNRRCAEGLLRAYPDKMAFENEMQQRIPGEPYTMQSDDIVVGYRWKAIGGASYIDLSSRLVHWGEWGYRGALDRHVVDEGYTFNEVAPLQGEILATPPMKLPPRPSIGAQLKTLREARGIAPEVLAEQIGAPLGLVLAVETNDVTPPAKLLARWQALLA